LTFDLESDVRVACDVGYLCAKFSLHIGLSVLDLGPMYAKDVRQTSDAHYCLMPLTLGVGHNKYVSVTAATGLRHYDLLLITSRIKIEWKYS